MDQIAIGAMNLHTIKPGTDRVRRGSPVLVYHIPNVLDRHRARGRRGDFHVGAIGEETPHLQCGEVVIHG